jgi:hypothetical protein
MQNTIAPAKNTAKPRIVFVKSPRRNRTLMQFLILLVVFPAALMTGIICFFNRFFKKNIISK